MEAIGKLSKFVKPYWRWMIIAPLLMLLEVAMDLMQPRLIEIIVDEGIAQLDLTIVVRTGALMIGLALIGVVGGVGNGVFAARAAQGFGADLRDALFRKVQSLSFSNLNKLETGQLVTRLTNDVTQVQEALYTLLRILVRAPLLFIGSLIMAIMTSPQLTFLPLVLLVIVLVFVVLIINKAYPMFNRVQQKLDDLNTVLQENLAGVRVIKAFVRTDYETNRFRNTNQELKDSTVSVIRTTAITMPIMMMIMNLGVMGVLWFGGIEVSQGNMQIGQIIAFVNYLLRTLFSLIMVSMLVLQTSRATASAKRIQEVLDSEPDIKNRPDALHDFKPQGRVAFENVSFSYNGDEHDAVLQGISFVAQPGETVALLGTTGAGKSSLVHLIPRFYDVKEGRITVDGVDVRDIDKATLRRTIGIALQETVLFSGTIRDNIRYGRPDASDEAVIAAAKAAQAHDFINSLPEGYATILGQRGVNLSGGQKQRVAIARALLLKPAILIFDDSTSAVDVETESKIQAALESLMHNTTSFIIAQRISTVLNADKILVLDDGKIAAEGNHHELLASSPIYQEIYASQLGGGVTND